MATVIVLSGGTGTRLGGEIPKQYLRVRNKPIIGYCLDVFQQVKNVSSIVVVAEPCWREMIKEYADDNGISKFRCFANAGKSRQHSVLNGLRQVNSLDNIDENELVVIHDAARPCVSKEIVENCIDYLKMFDCSMPIVPVKDTVYLSNNGKMITQLLNRDTLYAGQTPEGCHLQTYLKINELLTDEELLSVRGTSAIAFAKGLSVGLFPGTESNYKITTRDDLMRFEMDMEKRV